MGVRFIIGRAGTGKTALCAREICREMQRDPLGPPLLWIMPEQGTFAGERMLLAQHFGASGEAAGGCRGTFRAQVLSFRRLAMMIGRELGLFPAGDGRGVPKPMDDLARRVLLEEVVRREKRNLRVFGSAAERDGFITHLDGMMREFRQHGHTGASLRALVDETAAGALDAVTRLKLLDLAHLLDAWAVELEKAGEWDFEQIMHAAAVRLGESTFITGKNSGAAQVWIDAFSAMTALEMRMLAALARHAERVTVTLLADPDSPGMRSLRGGEDGLFSRTERLHRRLLDEFRRHEVTVDETMPLRDRKRFHAEGVRRIEAELFEGAFQRPEPRSGAGWAEVLPRGRGKRRVESGPTLFDAFESRSAADDGATPVPRPVGVELWQCSDPETEVRTIAQAIRSMGLGAQLDKSEPHLVRYRQIGVIVPDLGGKDGGYEDAIRRIFAEHGIPFFVDQRRSMAHHPLVEFVRAAVCIVTSGFDRDEMLLLLKTRLAGIAPEEVSLLENYLIGHGITRVPWDRPWTWLAPNTREEDDRAPESERQRLARVNDIRQKTWQGLGGFVTGMATISAKRAGGAAPDATADHYVRALRGLLDSFRIESTIASWANEARTRGDGELAQVHEQAWRGVSGLLILLEKVLAGRDRTLVEFERLLTSALGQLTLGLIPPTVDQVLVSSVTRSRVPEMTAAFVLGAVEGAFPQVIQEDPILSDAQRAAFNAAAADPIGDGSDRQLLEMPFFDYVALTRARRRLVISYPVADRSGGALTPSRYLPRLRELFGGGLTMASFDAGSRVRVGRMSTAEDVMSGVGQWARALLAGPPSEKHDAAMRPVYNWILATGDKAIGERREMLFRGLRPAPRAALSPAIAGRYFPAGKPLRLSITQLEQFAACPLQYFYHYQLNLSPREELSLDALGLGELQHNILEGLYRRIIREEFGWPHHDVELLHAALVEETDRAVGELHAELSQSTPGYGKTRRRILRALSHTVEADRRRASAGAMRPESVELFFGTTERRDGNGRVVALPVLPIPTPAGRQLQIWGKIDRLDKSDDGERTVLFDYKSSWRAADINHIFYGLSLQLPVYVLVAQRVAQLDPVGAFYVGLAQRRESREGPDASISPVNDGFYQRSKPRGFANAAAAFALDANLQPEDDGLTGRGWSDWYPLGFKRDGDIRKACDLLSVEDFATLLAYTAQKIAALADRLASGEIAPLPYKDRQDTPCIRCHFRAMCSFDPSRDPFRIIARRKKADLFRLMQEKC